MNNSDLKLLEKVSVRYREFTDVQHRKLWLSLVSMERQYDDAVSVLERCDFDEFDSIQTYLFKINFEQVHSKVDECKPYVGVWWNSLSFGSQLASVGKGLQSVETCSYIGIVCSEYVTLDFERRIEDFIWGEFLAIPDEESMQILGFLKAIVFSENYIWKTNIPSHVKRIAQPHGLDIPLRNTITKYGGPLVFDYILFPMKDDELRLDDLVNIYPAKLNEHTSKKLCAIPAGYAKLDEFLRACERAKIKKKIIYHISLFGIEDESVRENLTSTIELLLNSFPDRDVLFRPDPRDINNPILLGKIKQFLENSRFKVSKSSSYIQDYCDAELLVTHRLVTAHTFSFASGRPIIAFQHAGKIARFKRIKKTNVGYQVFNKTQLVEKIEDVFASSDKEFSRIKAYRDSKINNPGSAMQYLGENIGYIINDKQNPDWRYYDLSRNVDSNCMSIRKSLKTALHTGGGGDYTCLAEAAIEKYPNDLEIRLLGVKLLARFGDAFNHKIYFQFWYRSVMHLCQAIKLCPDGHPLSSDIDEWVRTNGVHYALALKWHLSNINESYGDDIDDLLAILCKREPACEFMKYIQGGEKYPLSHKVISKMKKIRAYIRAF